jgi:hypothetical protein
MVLRYDILEMKQNTVEAFLRATGSNIQFIFINQEMFSIGITESEETLIMVYCHGAG